MRKFTLTILATATAIVAGAGTLAALSSPLLASEQFAPEPASVNIGQQFIDIESKVDFQTATLRIAGPNGYALTRNVSVEDGPFITADLMFDAEPVRMHGSAELQQRDVVPDGTYRYEIEFTTPDGSSKVSTGQFRVENGAAYELQRELEADLINEDGSISSLQEPGIMGRVAGAVVDFIFPSAHAADVDNLLQIFDDTGDGNTHVFFDSDNGANWWLQNDQGDMYFKEFPGSNIRAALSAGGNFGIGTAAPLSKLHVNDTGGFQIRLTDGSITTRLDSFGSRFAVYGANSSQFSVHNTAPSHSLVVSSTGDVGLGTTSPAQKLHVDGNAFVSGQIGVNTTTPASELHVVGGGRAEVRIENSATQHFIGSGQSTGFTIRQGTDVGTTMFRIDNGAPANSMRIDSSGNTGIGTSLPEDKLHVRDDGGNTAAVRVETAGGSTSNRRLFFLRNNGNPIFRFEDTSDAEKVWDFRLTANGFAITRVGSGALEMDLRNNGNVTFAGTVQGGSSRKIKHGISEIDTTELLDRLQALPVKEWRYDAAPGERRIGPMAEDFFELFELGSSPEHIAASDMAGVAMAAAQALSDQTQLLQRRSDQLKRENAELRDRLDHLEATFSN